MAGGVDGHGGGIVGLVRLLNEHGEAIEYELLTIGRHIDNLGTRRLTWRDLKVVALGSPPGGALHRSIDPLGAGWTADTYLLAAVADYEALSVWQRGGKKNNKPKPVWRPNVKAEKKKSLTAEALSRSKAVADVR